MSDENLEEGEDITVAFHMDDVGVLCGWVGMDSSMEWNAIEKLTVVANQEIPPVHTHCHLFQQYRGYM